MCLVVYVASASQLPLIAWRDDAPDFNVTEVTAHEEPVRRHLPLPHVRQAGSHTGCGCGFNEGREYPEAYDDPAAEPVDAVRASGLLAQYVREHHVERIYSCWSGEEGDPQEFERHVAPEDLIADDFFFRQNELLIVQP